MLNLLRRRIHLANPLGIETNHCQRKQPFCNSTDKSFYERMTEAIEAAKNKQKPIAYKPRYEPRYNGKVKKRPWQDFTSEGNPEKRANFNPEDRVKRKKCCLLLGYSGAKYFGMQRNRDRPTIEEELLVAMLKHKWINEEGFKLPQMVHFQRAARTDKGVSAARQCVSLKLPDDLDLSAINSDLPAEIQIFGRKRVTKGFNSKDKCDARTYTYTLPTISFADHGQDVSMETYRLSNEKFEQLNGLLKIFVGTKNFHNFTSRKEYHDPSANRFIISFTCEQPFVDDTTNIEFAVMKVKGQSFMMHQIRKMIGLTLAVVRGLTTSDTLKRAFAAERIDVPMAPGLGLVLDQVHYDRYNTKYGSDGMHETLEWTEEEPVVKKFFDEFIFPTIVNTEKADNSMVNWLETLPMHSYDVRVDTDATISKSENENITAEAL